MVKALFLREFSGDLEQNFPRAPYDIVIVKWEKSSGVSVQNIEL
jgi:hypothetical protein